MDRKFALHHHGRRVVCHAGTDREAEGIITSIDNDRENDCSTFSVYKDDGSYEIFSNPSVAVDLADRRPIKTTIIDGHTGRVVEDPKALPLRTFNVTDVHGRNAGYHALGNNWRLVDAETPEQAAFKVVNALTNGGNCFWASQMPDRDELWSITYLLRVRDVNQPNQLVPQEIRIAVYPHQKDRHSRFRIG